MTAEEKEKFWADAGVPPVQNNAEPVNKENPAPTEPSAEPEQTPAPVTADPIKPMAIEELSTEELVSLLEKKGIKIPAKELTEEERRAEEAKNKNDARAWGLQTGKFKIEDYEELTKAETRKFDILVEEFEAEIRANHPDADEDVIQDYINSYTYSDLEDTSPVKIKRQKELLELANYKLKTKFSNIYNIDNDYRQYQDVENQKIAEARKVEAALPVFKQDVRAALDGFRAEKEILIEDTGDQSNNATIKISYSDEDLKEVENLFFEEKAAIAYVKAGYTIDALKDVAENVLMKKHFSRLVSKAAKDYNSVQKGKYLRGQQGILPNRELNPTGDLNEKSAKDQLFEQAAAWEAQQSAKNRLTNE